MNAQANEEEVVTYPGARRPDRRRTVDSFGVGISAYEWGAEDAPPLFLAHGGFDFAGTFDVFAPMLAEGGWRVVAWDHRGHGDSQHVAFYSWDADVRDALSVIKSTTREPAPLLGHSKGGTITIHIAEARPHMVTKLVNIDGLPSPRRRPDVSDHERTRMMSAELQAWLDHRRSAAGLQRKPGTIDELAARRGNMNPRLEFNWLRYLVTIGARRDPDGWRWKIDPALRFGGFGPWRPGWSIDPLAGISAPILGILGTEEERMGWGTQPEEVEPFLPRGSRLEVIQDTGHFVHIERPREVAQLVLDFLS